MSLSSDLLDSCRKLAEFTHPNVDAPTDINDIVDSNDRENVAQQFHQIAMQYARTYSGPRDPCVIVRAVNFMDMFAPQGHRVDDLWFDHTLNVLIRLVDPFVAPVNDTQFLSELRQGILKMETWAHEHKR